MAQAKDESAGVYVSLKELVRLRFQAKGFAFLPRQPMHSILAGKHASRLRGRGLNFSIRKATFQDAAALSGISLSSWARERLRRAAIKDIEEASQPIRLFLDRSLRKST